MAMVQVESYNFATVEATLSDGGNFSIIADVDFTGSLKTISGNLCEPTTIATAAAAFWSGSVPAPSNAWPADQYTELTLTTLISADFFYLVVRQGSATSGTQYLYSSSGGGVYTLFAVVAGTAHTLTTGTNTTAQGDTWRLSIAGNVLSVSRNGTVVTTFTDTNNYIASGSPGFGLYASSVITNAQTALWAAGANQAATPTFSPVAGTYTGTQTVTITSSTSGGTIYYTTDGTTPTHSSSSISNGSTISVASSLTVKALASVSNFVDSAVGSAAYVINSVALTFQQSTGGASGAGQSSFSLAYGSTTTTGSYLVCCVQYDALAGNLSISDNVNGAWTKVVANDSLISEQFEVWVLPVNAGGAVTVEAQVNTGSSFFQLVIGEYTGQVTSGALDANTPLTEQTNPTATYGPVTTSVANDQLIFIGFTGSSTVWTPAMGFTSRILSSAAGSPILMDGIAAAAGSHSFSATASASALFGALLAIKTLPVATSTFSPVAGTYSSTQSVTVSNTNSGLAGFAQYYTTDGSNPTTGSTLYSGPISVSTSQTLKVLAVATNYNNSNIASAAYVINSAGGGQGNQPAGNVIFDLDGGGFPIAELQTGTNA